VKCVIKVGEARAKWWKSHMNNLLPDIDFYLKDEDYSKNDIELAIVWKPENGWLKSFKNLKCIIITGAKKGVRLFIDYELKNCKQIYVHPLVNDRTLGISPINLQKFLTEVGVSADWVDLSNSAERST